VPDDGLPEAAEALGFSDPLLAPASLDDEDGVDELAESDGLDDFDSDESDFDDFESDESDFEEADLAPDLLSVL
jgi:hypothetical protein